MLMTTKFPLKMSERAFVCQLTLLNIDTYSNILIESSINTNEMFSRVNEKRTYVIDITFGINKSIFSGNEQEKVYCSKMYAMILLHANIFATLYQKRSNRSINVVLVKTLFSRTSKAP